MQKIPHYIFLTDSKVFSQLELARSFFIKIDR
jgi:hypothetical protein